MADWIAELGYVIAKWKGTPYCAGGSTAGCGACCYGFLVGVLDELHGRSSTPPLALPRIPQQLAAHSPLAATRFSLELIRRYPHEEVRIANANYLPEPGDVLLIRVGAATGHGMIVGDDPRQLWHASTRAGVCFTGIGPYRHRITRVYRSPARNLWQRCSLRS